MSELARDKVTKISFAIEVFGKEQTMGDSLKFNIDAVELQTIENPEVVSGWKLPSADNFRIFNCLQLYSIDIKLQRITHCLLFPKDFYGKGYFSDFVPCQFRHLNITFIPLTVDQVYFMISFTSVLIRE